MATVDEQRAERGEELEAEGAKRMTPPSHPDPSSFDADELKTASGKRVKVTDQEFAVMLERAGGFRSRLAKQLGVTVSAVSHRIKRSKYLTEVCKTVEETILDLAEAQLVKAAQNGEPWAITFILKCKGRRRGWIERQDIAFGGDPEALPPPIVIGVHDAAFVEAERARQRRELEEMADAAVIELKPEEAVVEGEIGETWGATAQPLDAGAGDGATVAPTEAAQMPEKPDDPEIPESPATPDTPPVAQPQPPRIPRTPSEAAAMRREQEARERGMGNGERGTPPQQQRPHQRPMAFPRRGY